MSEINPCVRRLVLTARGVADNAISCPTVLVDETTDSRRYVGSIISALSDGQMMV
jgi:hypothetical protein